MAKPIIQSWHTRAQAYDQLVTDWPLFSNLADRLIEALPDNFSGHALDIAAGSGLLSQRLLQQHPSATLSLIEPADQMRVLARQRLGQKVKLYNAAAEELDRLNLQADAALCSAAFHLMDETRVLPAVARALHPGGVFAVNLWGHSFDETARQEADTDWQLFVDQALTEFGEAIPPRAATRSPRLRSRDSLERIAASCGLELIQQHISEDQVASRFSIEFAAMSPVWLGHLETETRRELIKRALDLSSGKRTSLSVDFVFVKD